MRGLAYITFLLLLAGCTTDELSWISIRNNTEIPIYAMPYSSEFANSDWIQPGVMDEFYSINCNCLDGFTYFSTYYDSLIIYLKDQDETPIKFYQDGSAVNYDATQNPFTNPDVWTTLEYDQAVTGEELSTAQQETHISEHFFSINSINIKSLADTTSQELNPDS